MRILLLVSLLCMAANTASAKRYNRTRVDVKLASQKVIEAQSWDNVLSAKASTIVNDIDGPSSAAAVTVTSSLGTLDFPRALTITPTGTTADVANCTITVSGTDYNNDSVSEDFSIAANSSLLVGGQKIFRTVTSIAFPASCEDSPFSATWEVGAGSTLGLSRCMEGAADYLKAIVNNASDSSAIVKANTSLIEYNGVEFSTAPDGANDYKMYFVQSYGCD